jgi:hypothetical protein
VTLVSMHELNDWLIEGVNSPRILEMHTTSPSGDGVAPLLTGTVGSVVLAMSFSARHEAWGQAEISELASIQATRIRAVLAEPT